MLIKYLLPEEEIIGNIHVIQNQKVMLDFDLTLLYKIPTKRINEQVKRNIDRFPKDFTCLLKARRQVFQLSQKEWEDLRSQNATTKMEMRRKFPTDTFDYAQSAVLEFPYFKHTILFETKPKTSC